MKNDIIDEKTIEVLMKKNIPLGNNVEDIVVEEFEKMIEIRIRIIIEII